MEIGEMRFCRKCREGEQITLEARMRVQNDQGLTWDARGLDDQGRTIMQAMDEIDQVVEGLGTTKLVLELSKARGMLRRKLNQAYLKQFAQNGKAESNCR